MIGYSFVRLRGGVAHGTTDALTTTRSIPAQTDLTAECARLRRENETLAAERGLLELQVRSLKLQLWGRKSERHAPDANQQAELFSDPAPGPSPVAAPAPPRANGTGAPRTPKGPKPLDPDLRREVIAVADPALEELFCPATDKPMKPGFKETLEVLAREPAVYYVKRYERTVYVSEAKMAPVYSPWPAAVLPRSRVHASVVAHLATAHYADHLPFHRIEKQLARVGVDLPRNCQVALMKQLDVLVAPLVAAMKADVLGGDYLLVDATPIPVCDPSRPGAAREATLWAFRNGTGTVWFEYQASKSPRHPDRVLKDAGFTGLLQTDAANGLGAIGPPGKVIALGCFAHLRRYFFKATQAGDVQAHPYFAGINKLFRLDRLARHFRLGPSQKEKLRLRHSVPLFDALIQRARAESTSAVPKSELGKALHYLLAQQDPLRRCLEHARAELSTNAVERAIRPLKLGAKNWLHIGHPSAGPRLANLFTVVENCRQLEIDAEAYLIDLIARLPDHPVSRVAELLPRAWKPASTSAAPGSGANQSR